MDDNDKKILLEQYKIYTESTQRVTENRNQVNRFFISILSAIIAVIGIFYKDYNCDNFMPIYSIIACVLGLILCYVWYININNYKKLNSAKFAIIHEIEKCLPEACFRKEWEVLQKGMKKKEFAITRSEMTLPLLLSLPFIAIIVFSVIKLK